MRKIGLIDVDGGKNFPNIVLMKLSAWHKAQGDEVSWYSPFEGRYDDVYMSKVFSWTPDYMDCINADRVHKGGSGYCITVENGKEIFHKERDICLPEEVEHIYPDYSLYPRLTKNKAFGFLTRGCPRGCSFCIVGPKEGRCSKKVADLKEFWKGQGNIVLCDPNFLACRDWAELAAQLECSNAWIDFNQGLDIRLMTEEKAKALSRLKIKEVHFAWDTYSDKDRIIPKFELFSSYSKLGRHQKIVFTLTNYNTTLEQDLERIYTLQELGYWPYVTIYEKASCAPVYRKLQRWVNNRFIFGAVHTFEDYLKRPQKAQEELTASLF